ncbi:unnamed protein product [Pieris macdunnoughi]|uniref:Uncharacterized protein n=1 Tax=Pieris macdunnoughi TaxID=345717 RepID=A0A821VXJ0_9NEOP|nr:unnamed protein product [Pieris macdunnoughi]
MPAVKVFNIFGGQKPTEKRTPPPPANNSAPQKFYRTFSVAPEISPEVKGGKVTAIAACLEKRISEPVKVSSDNIQAKKLSSKNNISEAVCSKTEIDSQNHAYENVQLQSSDSLRPQSFKLLEKSKGYSSIYENITIFNKHTERDANLDNDPNSESKLNKALESFDKILSEFSTNSSFSPEINLSFNSNFVVPKLQKSKTCSIIESRCILKKTNSDPENERRTRNLSRNNSIDKTTSLWNLDDMKGKELTSPLKPLSLAPNDKINSDKYATYKISSKSPSRPNCINTEDLKKLDVKTRILKKTLSNPPSTPVPVVNKTKLSPKKNDKKGIEVKKTRTKLCPETTKSAFESNSRTRMQKAKSVWEIGTESAVSPPLERTKSSTSIAGSPSKIPVIRSQMSQNKFSSTRALFSPTPVDLSNLDQARECAQKKKLNISRKSADKTDIIKQTKQKSQLNLKADVKRSTDKTKKDTNESKKTPSPKLSLKDYSEEINAIRAKLQQKKNNNKRDLVIATSENKSNENNYETDIDLSPVKNIVKKIEFKSAPEPKNESAQFINCKVIPPEHKVLCVANTTFHNYLSTLVGRQIRCVESKNDSKICSQIEKLPLNKQTEEKISDTHSDCSDDSGHVSNDAVHDSDVVYDTIRDLSPVGNVDVVDCKMFNQPKQFRTDLAEDSNVCPVRPMRRGGRSIEVVSGTCAGADAPKVEEQVRHYHINNNKLQVNL